MTDPADPTRDTEDLDPVVTAIKPLKQSPTQLAVYAGSKRLARLPVDAVAQLHISVGVTWTSALAARAARAGAIAGARRDANRLLARRAYATRQLSEKLAAKKHDPAIVADLLDELTQKGLLDDEALARHLIDQYRAAKPIGRNLLFNKLLGKKLPADLIRRLLDELDADPKADPVADARRLAVARLARPSMRKVDAQTRRRRIWSLLARRGFDPATIDQALQSLPAEPDDELFYDA